MKRIMIAAALLLSATTYAQYQNTKIEIGQDAPELAFANPEGKIISLSKTGKGYYVLIDFWASWCGPCRRANPDVVRFYDEYKNKKLKGAKGFKIFSVSLDTKIESWQKAIRDDNLHWPDHVSDLKSWRSEAAEIYGVNYIPQLFLMGPDGKIIGKYNSAQEAKAELEKILSR